MNALARWKVFLGLIAIFVAGAVTGGFITIRTMKYQLRLPSEPRDSFNFTMDRLHADLRLTAEQEEKVRPVVQQMLDELRNLGSLDSREADGILSRAQERMNPQLTPDQRAQLQRMREEHKRRLEEWLNLPEPQL